MVSPDCKSAPEEDSCSTEKVSPGRGILPWKTSPANPLEWPVEWEGARSAQARIDSVNCNFLPISREEAKRKLIEKIKLVVNLGQSVQSEEPRILTPAELHRLYAGSSVPGHRYLASSLNAAVHSPEIARDPAKWLADIPEIKLASLVNAWLHTNSRTDYERLCCIGLDPDTDRLTGVLKMKQGVGYSGRPCTSGSREYVAFWVDRGTGFSYEGMASVAVYDFGWLPPAGLQYIVSLPAGLHSQDLVSTKVPKLAKVRAVLSWNTPPSTTDPYAPVVWGNCIEGLIPIAPSQTSRRDNQFLRPATSGATESDVSGAEGRIVDAAIRALTGMAFGPYAGLTVAPENTTASAGATDRSFAINAQDIDAGENNFTLYVSNCRDVTRGATTRLKHKSVKTFPQEKSYQVAAAPPEADGVRNSKRTPSAAPRERKGLNDITDER